MTRMPGMASTNGTILVRSSAGESRRPSAMGRGAARYGTSLHFKNNEWGDHGSTVLSGRSEVTMGLPSTPYAVR